MLGKYIALVIQIILSLLVLSQSYFEYLKIIMYDDKETLFSVLRA